MTKAREELINAVKNLSEEKTAVLVKIFQCLLDEQKQGEQKQ